MLRLESDGSLQLENAIGATAHVYLGIPPMKEGTGKVHVVVQGRTDYPASKLYDNLWVIRLAPDVVRTHYTLAYLLIASRRHTDVYEWAQRDVAFEEVHRRDATLRCRLRTLPDRDEAIRARQRQVAHRAPVPASRLPGCRPGRRGRRWDPDRWRAR